MGYSDSCVCEFEMKEEAESALFIWHTYIIQCNLNTIYSAFYCFVTIFPLTMTEEIGLEGMLATATATTMTTKESVVSNFPIRFYSQLNLNAIQQKMVECVHTLVRTCASTQYQIHKIGAKITTKIYIWFYDSFRAVFFILSKLSRENFVV